MSSEAASWTLPWAGLREDRVKEALEPLLEELGGLELATELEERDTVSVWLTLPPNPETGQRFEVELSFYDLGMDGVVLSLEPEWADNEEIWETAWDLAGAIADRLGGEEIVD